jgi:ATP-dependent Clp endopeptidase proteolytic subunit ClpP
MGGSVTEPFKRSRKEVLLSEQKLEQEILVVKAELVEKQVKARSVERLEGFELAKDEHNKLYVFDEAVSAATVKKCIARLTIWARQNPKCTIEVQINSPGGDVIAGFALIDFIHDLRAKRHRVDIVALGFAASMAGVILQAGTNRIMGANAILLIHEAQFGASGSLGEVEDRVKMVEIMHERILELFASRATPLNPKTTKKFIERKWARKDWWMPADEAAKLGFIDSIR